MHRDEHLDRLASLRGGAFTASDALAAGFTRGDIRTRTRRGDWTAVRRGAYIRAQDERIIDASARHRLLAAASVLTVDGAVISHGSAALAWGLPTLGSAGRRLNLTVEKAPGRTPAYPADAAVHVSALDPNDVTTLDGLPLTTVARTIVDLARKPSLRGGLMAADHALRHGLTTEGRLRDVLARQRGWPGVRTAKQVAELADARSESPGESASRAFFAEHALPVPDPQIELRTADGEFLGRVDFLWRDAGLIGEFDGLTKYTAPEVLRAEKVRQQRLEDEGWRIVRWTWRQITEDADATAARIRRALAA